MLSAMEAPHRLKFIIKILSPWRSSLGTFSGSSFGSRMCDLALVPNKGEEGDATC